MFATIKKDVLRRWVLKICFDYDIIRVGIREFLYLRGEFMDNKLNQIDEFLQNNYKSIVPNCLPLKIDEEQKIIYIKVLSGSGFFCAVEDMYNLLKSMPEYAAVKFEFNGVSYLITSKMSLEECKNMAYEIFAIEKQAQEAYNAAYVELLRQREERDSKRLLEAQESLLKDPAQPGSGE